MIIDDKVEKIMELAGNEHRYQYFIAAITFLLWIFGNIVLSALPYLEQAGEAVYFDQTLDKNLTDTLGGDICNYNYTRLETLEYSWVSELQIECEPVKTGLISSCSYIGLLIGALTYPIFTKIIGQKYTMILGNLLMALSLLISLLVRYYACYLVIIIFGGIACNLICYSTLAIEDEFCSKKLRATLSSLSNVGFGFGGIIYVILFWQIQKWDIIFIITIVCLVIITIIGFIFVNSSPREALHKNFDDFMKILKLVAKYNNRTKEFEDAIELPENKQILDEIKQYVEDLKMMKEKKNKTHQGVENKAEIRGNSETNQNVLKIKENEPIKIESETEIRDKNLVSVPLSSKENINEDKPQLNTPNQNENEVHNIYSAFTLLKYRSLRPTFLILCLVWFLFNGIYSSQMIGIKDLPGNVYVNGIILFAIECVTYVACFFIIDTPLLGRKKSVIISAFTTGVFFLIMLFIMKHDTATIVLSCINRFFVTFPNNTMMVYCLEVYPTPLRSIGFCINAIFYSLGGIVIPLLMELLSMKVMYIVFVVISVINGGLFFLLPETQGKPLPEVVVEIEEERKKKNNANTVNIVN